VTRLFLAFAFFLIVPFTASAASLYVSPASLTLTAGQTGTFTVYVESSSQAMNAVSTTITADPGLSITSASKTGSIISFWATEPFVSGNSLSLEGVVLNPGYTGSAGKIASFTVRAPSVGTYSARFLSGSVLANDGQGTDITSGTRGGTVTVTQAKPVEPKKEEPEEVDGDTPDAPKVTSKEFPTPDAWYSRTDGAFEWELPDSVTAVRTLLDQTDDSVPSILLDGRVSSRSVTDIPDGVNYLHVQFKNAAGWGDIAHVRVAVDTNPPVLSKLNALERSDPTDPLLRVDPDAEDAESGVKGYEASVDGSAYLPLTQERGYYLSGALLPGEHKVLIRAVDEAGNVSPARETTLVVEPLVSPVVTFWTESAAPGDPLMVSGTAPVPGTHVVTTLTKGSENIELGKARVESDGTFSLMVSPSLKPGTYRLSAYVEDDRGARSLPVEPGKIQITGTAIPGYILTLVQIVGALVALLAVVGGGIWLILVLLTRIAKKRRELLEEIQETDSLTHRAFLLLRKDLAGYSAYLKKERKKRELTMEEEDFVAGFDANLKETEELIRKEIDDIRVAARRETKK
jgi:hypothetical protein